MAALTWNEVLQSADYSNQVAQIQAALGRQFKAVPSASPALREAATQEGARLTRLKQMGAAEQQATQEIGLRERRLALGEREQGMERQELRRYASRLPYANLLGAAGTVISGLSAYGNLAAARRSEARGVAGRALETERYGAMGQGLEAIRRQQQQQAEEYRRFRESLGYTPP